MQNLVPIFFFLKIMNLFFQDRVKAAIRKFGESAMQWEGNDMTKESDIVAARMTNMISNLK